MERPKSAMENWEDYCQAFYGNRECKGEMVVIGNKRVKLSDFAHVEALHRAYVEALQHEPECRCWDCQRTFGFGEGEKMGMELKPGATYTYVDEMGVRRLTSTEEIASAVAGDEVDCKAKAYQLEHPGATYEHAVELVLEADEDLKTRYALGE